MIKQVIYAMCLLSYTVTSHALEWYAGLDANYIQTKVTSPSTDAEFNPIGLGGRVGFYLQRQVGLEVYGLTGLADNEDEGLDLALEYSVGVAARFETPETEGGKLYFLLGYGITELDLDRNSSGSPGKESFDDFSYGGGVEFKLGNSDAYLINLQVVRYYSGDDISIGGASIGLRYLFN